MFNQVRKIEDAAIKIDQIKSLMGTLLSCRDSISQKYQENIVHVAFDILSEQEKALLEVSAALSGK